MQANSGFSLREYLSQQHAADGVQVDRRMEVAGVWCKNNRHRSVRELVRN